MSYATERAFAEANGTDIRDPRPAYRPVTKAEADWIKADQAAEIARINRVVAARLVEDKADMRARCKTDHAREVREAASRFAYVLAAAKTDGFLTPHAAEIKELMLREVRALEEQQERAR